VRPAARVRTRGPARLSFLKGRGSSDPFLKRKKKLLPPTTLLVAARPQLSPLFYPSLSSSGFPCPCCYPSFTPSPGCHCCNTYNQMEQTVWKWNTGSQHRSRSQLIVWRSETRRLIRTRRHGEKASRRGWGPSWSSSYSSTSASWATARPMAQAPADVYPPNPLSRPCRSHGHRALRAPCGLVEMGIV
jgi:hypothetical protein